MLTFFIKSKTRAGLLKIFFSNPNKKFYIRELARTVKTSAGNIQKELSRFEKEKILHSERIGPLKFYSVNLTYPLFDEISKIVSKTIGIEAEIKAILRRLKFIKFAFIFGSYAKGDFHGESDIDLFLIGNVDETDLITKLKIVERKIQREIHFHIAKPHEFLDNLKHKFFYQNILSHYVLLTDNAHEFNAFIEKSGTTRKAQKTRIKK